MTTKEIFRFCQWWIGFEEVILSKPTDETEKRRKLFLDQCNVFNSEMFPKKYKIVISETKTAVCQIIHIEDVIKFSDEKYNTVGILID